MFHKKHPHFSLSTHAAINKFHLSGFIPSLHQLIKLGDDGSQQCAHYDYITPAPGRFEKIQIWTPFCLNLPLPNDFYDPMSEHIHCSTQDPILVKVNPNWRDIQHESFQITPVCSADRWKKITRFPHGHHLTALLTMHIQHPLCCCWMVFTLFNFDSTHLPLWDSKGI